MKLKIDPVAKPRMTRSDKWKERPAVMKYRAYADEVRLKWDYTELEKFPEQVHLLFIIPMPKSWSKKKKEEMEGMPHQQTPDTDNLTKAIKDIMCGNDSYVYNEWAEKYWGYRGEVHIDNIDDIKVT